jgi:CheY-like chemotaxis protein
LQIRGAGFDVLVNVDTLMRARLVIVEDNQDNLEALSTLLAETYDVFGYESPTEALNAIETIGPDLLVLDIGTAPMNGMDCLKLIRAIPGYLDVPAVAFTGYGRDVERQAFLAAGFQAVVVKPFLHPQELIGVIERLLASRAAAEQRAARYRPRSVPPAVSQLDVQKTTTASSARGFGKTDGPGSAPTSGDETAG